MSGILPGIALVNRFDANGELMRDGLLRLYAAGTNTPSIAYKDDALTAGQEHPWPIPADSAGMLPMFYVADGLYRVRFSSADGGYVSFDVPVIEAVSPSGGGGGGGGGVSPEVIYQTGDLKPRLGSGVHAGFARLNGRTIGNATSGATERANSDTQSLFEYLYSEFDDTICPVIGGRGSSATADFNAGKQLTLIDGKGRTFFGADGMGATRANRLTTATFATPDTVGTYGGAEKHTLTVAELPAVTLTFTGDPATITSTSGGTGYVSASTVTGISAGPGSDVSALGGSAARGNVTSTASYTPAGSIEVLGDGDAFAMTAPGFVGTWYVKL